jgi:hypothetical protein
MTALVIVGEAWEAPFAAATLRDAARRLPASATILVPPELAGIAGPRPVSGIGRPPGRFRGLDEIVADVRELLGSSRYRLVQAGAPGPPRHRPPARRRHRHRQTGELDIWTADTGDGYFAALLAQPGSPRAPVWPMYGPGRPVFTVNTNDFNERPPGRHDDYVILGSGLLGLRMVVHGDPGPGARVLVYDINPDQLAWSRFVLARAGQAATLAELERSFQARHPRVVIRASLPHERDNAAAQAAWYQAHRRELAALPGRVNLRWLEVDLLNRPGNLLGMLRPDRSVFFTYLDLFVVWHMQDSPPWIVEFPGLARSLENEVRRRAAAATFQPGPGSRVLQLPERPQRLALNGG